MAILLDSTVEHPLNLIYVPSVAFKDPSLFKNKIDHNTIYWGGKISKDGCNGKISSQHSEAFEIYERRKKSAR